MSKNVGLGLFAFSGGGISWLAGFGVGYAIYIVAGVYLAPAIALIVALTTGEIIVSVGFLAVLVACKYLSAH